MPGTGFAWLFLGGLVVLGLLMALTAVHFQGDVVLWENAHWTWSFGLAFVVASVGAHRAIGDGRRTRGLLALGFLSAFVGQIVWDIQVASDFYAFPAPSDLFYLGLGIPVLAAFAFAVRDTVNRGQHLAVYLDAATVFMAVVTLAAVFHARFTPDAPPLQAAVLLAYPILYISTAGAGLVTAMAGRFPMSRSGHYPLLVGLTITGLAWLVWNAAAISEFPAPGSPINYVFDIGVILAAYGAATWSTFRRADAAAPSSYHTIGGMVPITMVLVAIGAMLLANETGSLLVEISGELVVVLAVARQAVLLRERNKLVAEQSVAVIEAGTAAQREREAVREIQASFDAQRQSEERYRAVVEVFDRLGEQMTLAADESELLRAGASAMHRLVTSDRGDVLVINPSEDRLILAAAWGADSAPIASAVDIAAPTRCLGIRRGSVYVVDDAADDLHLPCPAHPAVRGSVICVPMLALGQIVGVIHLERSTGVFDHDAQRQASRVAEQVALAVANVRLIRTMEGLALTDPLTGLHNARFFDPLLERELAMGDRPGEPVGVIMMDIDHFKEFNDSYGHPAGDEALRAFARVTVDALRPSDALARYGGEEFVVLVHQADLETTADVAERIRVAVEAMHIDIGPGRLARLTVSCGVATSALHGTDRLRLMKIADKALYRAKRLGRNQVVKAGPQRMTKGDAEGPIRLDARR